MKAIVCKEFGPPEKLVLEEVDEPVAGPGELIIDVRASAVTFPDALMIEDKYQFKAPVPFIPGGEVAGVVQALGEGVTDFEIGERVVGSSGLTGGFAERCKSSAAATRRIPENLGFAESTGLFYAYGTSYYGLKNRGKLKAGETLLVLGAAGNVGLAAVELGKLMGARVIAAASSRKKLSVCLDRGADETIDYGTEDLKKRAKELTDGRGVDVVFDCIGGPFAEAALRAIAWEGRFLVIGFTAGIPNIPLNLTLLKGCDIVGVFLGSMVSREPETRIAIEKELDALAAAGKLNPYVSERFSLADGPEALAALLARKVTGEGGRRAEPLARRGLDRFEQRFVDAVGDQGMAFGGRMNPVRLIQPAPGGDVFEQEGHEPGAIVFRQPRVDGIEGGAVGLAEIGGGSHARDEQPGAGVGRPGLFDDLTEIGFERFDALPSQHVIRAQFEHEHGDGQAKQPVEAAKSAS